MRIGARATSSSVSLRVAALAVVLTALTLLAGCAGRAQAKPATNGLRALPLSAPIAKPPGTLTDTSGRAYDMRTATAGRLTLLYFGYTHCVDVCPTTLSNIAVALRQLAVLRSRVSVVFITTDPDRDTPVVLEKWLARFTGADIVGLTGSSAQIQAAAKAVGVPYDAPVKQANGTYAVAHGSQVLAFGPHDNLAHGVYTDTATSDDYAHDLPLLVNGQIP